MTHAEFGALRPSTAYTPLQPAPILQLLELGDLHAYTHRTRTPLALHAQGNVRSLTQYMPCIFTALHRGN